MRIRHRIHLFCIIFLVSACENDVSQSKKEVVIEVNSEDKTPVFPDIPDVMEFCGEQINLQDWDVRERLDREILVNAYYHSAMILYLKRAHRFFPIIDSLLNKENLPNDLKYLAVAESGLAQVSSPAGAKGFWQFMEGTAKDYNLRINDFVDERYHLEKSTLAACKYLKNARKKFASWSLTLASYNRGIGGVQQDLNWQDADDYFDTHMNNETGRYVFRMLALKLIMEHPEAYGISINEKDIYAPYETQDIESTEKIENLAAWAKTNGSNYKIVKLLNPWIMKNTLPKDTFTILLPANTMNLKPMKAYK